MLSCSHVVSSAFRRSAYPRFPTAHGRCRPLHGRTFDYPSSTISRLRDVYLPLINDHEYVTPCS
ncbi:hypothetical protein K523DRAFT_230135 [Schizophyllum commune Tattone D]|nr:hypothetical protein K523DRAFT_230135 [Schizophyllum commune Tattone D]